MGTRNTPLLEEILDALAPVSDKADALAKLEMHFQHRLLVDAGGVFTIGLHAEQLRLQVDRHECSVVLDEIARRRLVTVSLEMVEEVVNHLFPDRFIEP